eukprot:11594566-Alexandrium_andersonii.AAC.1
MGRPSEESNSFRRSIFHQTTGGSLHHPGSPAKAQLGWNGISSSCRCVRRTSGASQSASPQPPATKVPASVTSGTRP